MYLFFSRECPACHRVFKSDLGLKLHCGKEGTKSLCNRYHNVGKRADKMKEIQARKTGAKKTKVSKVDLTTFNGALSTATHYTKTAKTMALNLIKVSTVQKFTTFALNLMCKVW